MQKLLDEMGITTNKNSVVGDKSMITPGGIRLGTPALTTRGFKEDEFKQVAYYLTKAVEIAKRIQQKSGKKLVDFERELE